MQTTKVKKSNILFILAIQLLSSSLAFGPAAFSSSPLEGGGGTSANTPPTNARSQSGPQQRYVYSVVAYQTVETIGSGLPATLQLTFELPCYLKFMKLIRNDWTDPDTQVRTIALGALVQADTLSTCSSSNKVVVNGGLAFSGVAYQIVPIR